MRKKLFTIVAIALMAIIPVNTAFAVEVLPNNGEESTQEAETEKDVPEEPLAKPDPNEVKVSSSDAHYVQNEERQDSGTVKLEWNGSAYSKYGCSTADINYTNTLDSNIDVKLSVGIFDGDLLEYFGTTFRTEKEINDLALKGFEALKSGISVSNAAKLVELGYFGERNAEEIAKLGRIRRYFILGQQKFANLSTFDLFQLTEDKVKEMSEKDKLTLAQLGGYEFDKRYAIIGETNGYIEPGYAIYKVDLNQLIGDGFYEVEDSAGNTTEMPYGLRGGNITLPRRVKIHEDGTKETISYNAVYILNAFDKEKNEFSKVFIHLPIDLYVEEDLPEELQKEYNVTLAELVTDESSNQ